MAITDVRVRRSLQLSETQDDKGNVKTTASQSLLVVCDAKNPSFNDILANTATWTNLGGTIPQLGDKAVVNGRDVYVTQRDLQFDGDSDRVVVMDIKYSARENNEEKDNPQGSDPETWQRITIQTQQVTEPARGYASEAQAKNAGPQDFARNSAGDPVDGLEEDTALVRMTYTNTAVVEPRFKKLNEYVNTCNDNEFLAADSYCVRCVGWSGEYDQKNNVWSISIEFLYKPDDWSIMFYDVGFNEIIDQKRVAILDRAGNPVSKPVPLDGNGKAATIGDGNAAEDQFQPVPLSFRYLYPYLAVSMNNIFDDCGV